MDYTRMQMDGKESTGYACLTGNHNPKTGRMLPGKFYSHSSEKLQMATKDIYGPCSLLLKDNHARSMNHQMMIK